MCRCACSGHGGWLTDGAISATGSQAITTSGDELAVVWDMAGGSCQNVLEGHSGEVCPPAIPTQPVLRDAGFVAPSRVLQSLPQEILLPTALFWVV